ncbi:UNVERIFIED_CONTAM: 4-hydroxy-tetrahydrodipicolinate synthase, chloroplastic [Sesamum radiatum]|uniref:4-hydroxy-tetrahydrodipicolinate synthase, chloroplastic n=1 Tax=Sesamum radiatum TaxID=300843 RepID=A0AAW2W3K7_SESRA
MASAIGCCSLKVSHQVLVHRIFRLLKNIWVLCSFDSGTSVDDIKSLRLITAIKTPYLPDGRFDLEAYDTLVNMQIEHGVEGVIVGGTTGEGQLMSWDEHIMLIGHTVNCFGGSIKVIGNTGSNSTREAIHATEQGFAVGMHAALHINPYYGKTSLEGIKECVGNDRVEQYTSHGLVVWSGNDDQCHDSRWDYGATGEPNPIGLNTALAQLGVVRPVFRLPYAPLPLAKRVEFVNIVKELGRENFVGDEDVQVLDDNDFILIGRY